MKSWGVYCVLFGIGAFVLPMMGYQFTLLQVFGEKQSLVGGGLIAVGVVLLGLSFRQPASTQR